MGRDSIDRQALLDAGLDPDDPTVWETQLRISDLLVCLGVEERSNNRASPARRGCSNERWVTNTHQGRDGLATRGRGRLQDQDRGCTGCSGSDPGGGGTVARCPLVNVVPGPTKLERLRATSLGAGASWSPTIAVTSACD